MQLKRSEKETEHGKSLVIYTQYYHCYASKNNKTTIFMRLYSAHSEYHKMLVNIARMGFATIDCAIERGEFDRSIYDNIWVYYGAGVGQGVTLYYTSVRLRVHFVFIRTEQHSLRCTAVFVYGSHFYRQTHTDSMANKNCN